LGRGQNSPKWLDGTWPRDINNMETDKWKKGNEPAIRKLGGWYFPRKTGYVTLRPL
jgi:hypothetical protein